ncbi:hypothetical protein ACO0K7_18865 [Undibacterium sp. Ji67W]|uniref:hypothetical protein n=1 Tax=Undibacterium sp. Ji67W TaxID=3413042 RepID=UPI003BF192A8
MSIDNKHHLQIVGINTLKYKSKMTGIDGEMKLAQCIVKYVDEEKGEQIMVGELLLPKHLSDTLPGEYLADFELVVDREKRIGARLKNLHAYGQVARPVAAKEDKKAA